MPVCIICLVIALVCTCTKYKKARQQSTHQAVESGLVENLPPQTSIHQLPLPPIPIPTTDQDVDERTTEYYEYTSELAVEANRAYGTNLTNDAKDQYYDDPNLTTEANRAYGSNLTTAEPINRAIKVNSGSSVTEDDQAYELDDITIANDSNLKTNERNKAYGLKLLPNEPTRNKAAAPSHLATGTTAAAHVHVPTIPTAAYSRQHDQLAEESGDTYITIMS